MNNFSIHGAFYFKDRFTEVGATLIFFSEKGMVEHVSLMTKFNFLILIQKNLYSAL